MNSCHFLDQCFVPSSVGHEQVEQPWEKDLEMLVGESWT